MRRLSLGVALAALPGCSSLFGLAAPIVADAPPREIDGPGCSLAAFKTGPNSLTLSNSGAITQPAMSDDPTELYYIDQNDTLNGFPIRRATRSNATGPFTPVGIASFGNQNPNFSDFDVGISADGCDLVFTSDRANDSHKHMYEVTRPTPCAGDTWSTPPVEIPELSTQFADHGVALSFDGHAVYFSTDGDLFVARRGNVGEVFAAPTKVEAGEVQSPTVTYDELELFYEPIGAPGQTWHLVRTDATVPFPAENPTNPDVFDAGRQDPDVALGSKTLIVQSNGTAVYFTRPCN